MSAPVSYIEIVIGYVGAAATKSVVLGLIILGTSGLFVPLEIAHPLWMIIFLVLTSVAFCLFGFILGIWAEGFEKLQLLPFLIIPHCDAPGLPRRQFLLGRYVAAVLADG